MRAVALLLAMGLPAPVCAEVWVSPYSHTEHFRYTYYVVDGARRQFVDSHPSFGLEVTTAPGESVAAGVYRDSFGGTSAYLARRKAWKYGVGWTVGALIGHRYPHGVVPFLGPEYVIGWGDFKVSVGYLPNFGVVKAPDLGIVQFSARIF